jgi:D-3-phosphoglycerate dehydrogenase
MLTQKRSALYRIWFERPLPAIFAPLLEGIATPSWATPPFDDSIAATLNGVNAIVASARIRYNAAFFEQVPSLRVVSRTGIGVDNINLADATAYGVAICNTPDVPTAATAEHAVALMMALMRQLRVWEDVLRQSERRDYFTAYDGVQADGAQLGVIGLGRIGSRVARVGKALGMAVIGYDPFCPVDRPIELGITSTSDLGELLSTSDVVTLHLPSTAETYHLLDAARIAQMKPGSFLVNTARGTLVDEAALLDALNSGQIRGAGLDVFDREPPPYDHPLVQHPNVISTPHIGGATVQAKDRLWREAIAQALQVLSGERPPNLVNPDVWPVAALP